MAEPFIGEIRIFAGNFAPRGWMFCEGQLLSIAQNTPLLSLMGTTYGGNGQSTFGLPDLRGRIPVHAGAGPGLAGVALGQVAGTEEVTLVAAELPQHTHPLGASTQAAATGLPAGNVVADSTSNGALIYKAAGAPVTMSPAALEPAGASNPHENRAPYLAVSYIIAVEGIFPSRN